MQDQIFNPKIIENNSNVNFSIAKSAQEIVQFQERQESRNQLGAVHILRNTKWGGGLPDLLQYYIGGGLPNLLQYYIGVGLESLLQYYSFVRKMEGYNPFSALY